MLVPLPRAVDIRIKPREKLVKGLLIEIPLTDLMSPEEGRQTDCLCALVLDPVYRGITSIRLEA
jgi:hypothetical protein